MSEIKNTLATYTSESIKKKDSDAAEICRSFFLANMSNYLIKEKGAVQSVSFNPNVRSTR
jgi:hypothetical protein